MSADRAGASHSQHTEDTSCFYWGHRLEVAISSIGKLIKENTKYSMKKQITTNMGEIQPHHSKILNCHSRVTVLEKCEVWCLHCPSVANCNIVALGIWWRSQYHSSAALLPAAAGEGRWNSNIQSQRCPGLQNIWFNYLFCIRGWRGGCRF